MDQNTKLELPIGLGMTLATNPEAMIKFSSMDIQHKQKLIDDSHNVNSKQEMQSLVNNLLY